MSGEEFVGFVSFGFSLSMGFYFLGLIPRLFGEIVDSYINRK